MERYIVIHYGELGLKKGNREYFENALRSNIEKTLKGCGAGSVRRISGRFLLNIEPSSDLDEIKRRLSGVSGLAYFAEAWSLNQNVEALKSGVWSLVAGKEFGSFRIDTRRSEKQFPLTSVQVNEQVGAHIQQHSGARVDLENPDLVCWIEIVEKYALAYFERIKGPGGLPLNTSGKVVVLLSGGIDSPVAAWKIIKRGCSAVFVHFHSFPYTNRESQEKAKQLASLLARRQLQSKIYLVPFAEIQRQIMVHTPAETRVILYRRYMLRLAEQIAQQEKAKALVTGDSIGQVASQTLENIDVISRATSLQVLRPLVGDSKDEIIELARRIGTYEISIQPDQDCCSLFVPRHPKTKATAAEIERAECLLDLDDALKQALDSAEVLLQYAAYETGTVRQL